MSKLFSFILQHWPLWLAFILILALIIRLELKSAREAARQLSPQQATLMINNEQAVVVDVREATEYANGHILGAVNLPLSGLKDNSKPIERYSGRPIIIVCQRGHRSMQAIGLLQTVVTKLNNLRGGMQAWQEAGMPVEK